MAGRKPIQFRQYTAAQVPTAQSVNPTYANWRSPGPIEMWEICMNYERIYAKPQ